MLMVVFFTWRSCHLLFFGFCGNWDNLIVKLYHSSCQRPTTTSNNDNTDDCYFLNVCMRFQNCFAAVCCDLFVLEYCNNSLIHNGNFSHTCTVFLKSNFTQKRPGCLLQFVLLLTNAYLIEDKDLQLTFLTCSYNTVVNLQQFPW